MEIFDLHKTQEMQKDKIEVLHKQQQKQEFKLIGRVRRVPGLTMYSYNLKIGEIKVAEIEQCKSIDYTTRKPLTNAKILIEKDCIYRQALNIRNFVKRLVREGVPVKVNSN